jgi:hypothetical protein
LILATGARSTKSRSQRLAAVTIFEHGENAVILGPPGIGRTHLAVGLEAIEAGYRVLFTTAATTIAWSGRQSEIIRRATRLLIVDEIGYLPTDRLGSNFCIPAHQLSLRERADDLGHLPQLWCLGRSLRGSVMPPRSSI